MNSSTTLPRPHALDSLFTGSRIVIVAAALIGFSFLLTPTRNGESLWTIVTVVVGGSLTGLVGVLVFNLIAARSIEELSREHDHVRAESAAVGRITDRVHSAADVREAIRIALGELLTVLEARTVLLVAHDRPRARVHLWRAERTGREPRVTHAKLQPSDARLYLFSMPSQSWYATDRLGAAGRRFECRVLSEHGAGVEPVVVGIPDAFAAEHSFHSMLALWFSLGEDWHHRLFVLDAPADRWKLRLLDALARQVTPAIQQLDLLGRLRSRVSAAERARVARELHDGVIQSLIGLEMQVETWKRAADGVDATAKLGRIQEVLRQEIAELRDLIRQLKPPHVDSHQVLEYLADLVEQFRRHSGISAHFVSEIEELRLSPPVCGELVRIVQEALVNVRKHSAAHNVLVRVSAPEGHWKFEVDDDGRGFGFAGRLTQSELEAGRKGPVVIKERVRAIGGMLAVESNPGKGARIEVWLPRASNG